MAWGRSGDGGGWVLEEDSEEMEAINYRVIDEPKFVISSLFPSTRTEQKELSAEKRIIAIEVLPC